MNEICMSDLTFLLDLLFAVAVGGVVTRLVFGKKVVLRDREVLVEVARPCPREGCAPPAGEPLPPPPIVELLADLYDDEQLREVRAAYVDLTPERAHVLKR